MRWRAGLAVCVAAMLGAACASPRRDEQARDLEVLIVNSGAYERDDVVRVLQARGIDVIQADALPPQDGELWPGVRLVVRLYVVTTDWAGVEERQPHCIRLEFWRYVGSGDSERVACPDAAVVVPAPPLPTIPAGLTDLLRTLLDGLRPEERADVVPARQVLDDSLQEGAGYKYGLTTDGTTLAIALRRGEQCVMGRTSDPAEVWIATVPATDPACDPAAALDGLHRPEG